MPGIGLEGDRVRLLADLEQPAGHDHVHDGREEHHAHAPTRGLDRLRRKELVGRLVDDPPGGEEDEHRLPGAGDVLDLAVTERVLFVGHLV